MSNPYFQQTQNNHLIGMFNQFKQNPMQFLTNRRIQIPEQYKNNPQQAIQYLMNNGQLSQETLNNLMQKAQQMGIKF